MHSSHLGASLNWALLGRNPSEVDCLMVLLTDAIWEALCETTNARLARQLATSSLTLHRRYKPATVSELKRIFFARMDMIVRNVSTIELAFREVLPLPEICFLSDLTALP